MDLMIVRKAHLALMSNSIKILNIILSDVSQHDATTYRDNGDGWTVLEVLCHLRDYDEIFYQRANQILNEEDPTFVPRDHEALVIENEYNNQNLHAVLAELNSTRARFITFFESLTPEQWERNGFHPEYGEFPMTRSAIQVGTHDVNHIEQITRILKEKK
ncbi:MAG: DinB family protein [Phototrophicales bacterium]|nr:DinB family protein [Phototrophicales bacterium]